MMSFLLICSSFACGMYSCYRLGFDAGCREQAMVDWAAFKEHLDKQCQ